MSSHFHNTLGWHLGGIELHSYGSVAGLKQKQPHASMQFMFFWPAATLWKKAKAVTAERLSMLQQGYDFYLILHVPMPSPPPGPTMPIRLAQVIRDSGSKLQMAVQSVTSGNPLACCIYSCASANMNCSDPAAIPSNAVFDFKSVRTRPTPGDYVAAAAGQLLDEGLGKFLGWTAKVSFGRKRPKWLDPLVQHTWRRVGDYFPLIDQGLSVVAKAVQETVDGAVQ
jgi:hypothetical protein